MLGTQRTLDNIKRVRKVVEISRTRVSNRETRSIANHNVIKAIIKKV